jgi:hypothetical protein
LFSVGSTNQYYPNLLNSRIYKLERAIHCIIKMKRAKPEEGDLELLAVEAMSLSGVIRSKKDIYEFFLYKMQYFLPPFKECDIRKSS